MTHNQHQDDLEAVAETRPQGKPGTKWPFKFADDRLETEFLNAHRTESARYVRGVAVVGLILLLAFMWQDNQLSPRGHVATNLRIYVGTPLCILAWLLCAKPWASRFIEPITAIFFLAYTLTVVGITLVFEPGPHGLSGTDGSGVMLLLVVAALMFSSLRFIWGLAVGGGILLIYFVSVSHWTNADFDEFLLGNFSVAIMGFVMGATASAMLERLRRKQFLALDALRMEKERYKILLHTLVPSSIASRIEQGEFPIADSQAEVAILFADLVGFTSLTQEVAPRTLVQLLNELFTEFDQAAERHQVEKIKTIGDGYMAACGPPVAEDRRTLAAVLFGQEMVAITQRVSEKYGLSLGIRVGIHTGSLIAGVIGKRRYTYDMWGDSVNIASRMESSGVTNRIQVSESAYQRIKDVFTCEGRGELQFKGIGSTKAYLVDEDAISHHSSKNLSAD